MNNSLLIFTAPPAAGKTHLITQLIGDLGEIPLVISPLRALANECIQKWGSKAQVMTPEEWLHKGAASRILVLDEFHLFFYWGDSFRPNMWEAFFGLVEQAEVVLALTATLTPEMVEEIKSYHCHFSEMLWVDHGNQQLKNKPTKYHLGPSRQWLENLLESRDYSKGGNLIFCAYRAEVIAWEKRLEAHGYSVWTCLGGEAAAFSERVQAEAPPQFIIATTVLSHGVNLPQISRIFFLYKVNNLDFWIQMVARGGRRGEAFEVFALERPVGLEFSPLRNHVAVLIITLQMRLFHIRRQIEEWFLKAS